ncbi:hypothetical protein ACFQ1S_18210 [Kibdelosporangium lantanae]|uniref:Uncharacterized protein n=1 Tax=Kibdelosporangium lantanae TaxID=1497396 RepID=A0ABW3M9C9_9PSEU
MDDHASLPLATSGWAGSTRSPTISWSSSSTCCDTTSGSIHRGGFHHALLIATSAVPAFEAAAVRALKWTDEREDLYPVLEHVKPQLTAVELAEIA